MLNLNRLRLLHELSILGSITAVAQALHLTRPAISQQLALLESEVGEPLLERSTRGTRMTPAGEYLAARAGALFAIADELDRDLQANRSLVAGRVRVSAFGSLAIGLVPEAFRQLKTQHPQVCLHFTETESNAGLKAVITREIDLAVIDEWADIMRLARPLEFAQLGVDQFVLAVASDHPLAGRKTVRLQALSAEAWAINQNAPAYRAHLMRACQAAGFTPNEVCNCQNVTATMEFVRTAGMVAILPTLSLGPFRRHDGIRLISLSPPIHRKIRVAMLPRALARPAVKAVFDALRQVASRPAAGTP